MRSNRYNLFESFHDNDAHSRYRGCGNGWIQVEKATGLIVEMSYSDDPDCIEREQNVVMCRDAGRVLREDEKYIWYRANFSCAAACLF